MSLNKQKGKLVLIILIVAMVITGFTSNGQAVGKNDFKGLYYLDLPEYVIRDLLSNQNYEIVGYTNIPNRTILSKKKANSNNGSEYLVYNVKSGDSLYKIAREFETTVDILKEINDFNTDLIYVGQKIYVPVPDIDTNRVYTVQPGDSLYKIAIKYGITIQQLKTENNLKTDIIYTGQVLYIPHSGTPDDNQNPDFPGQEIYVVSPGDSLYKIAIKFNTTIQKIKIENNLQNDMIYVGQKLRIPLSGDNNGIPDNSDTRNEIIYYVKPGDSLYEIAREYNVTVSELKSRNNLESEMLIVGQKLYISVPASDNPDDGNSPDLPGSYNMKVRYVVEKGDNIFKLAEKFNTTLEKILKVNELDSGILSEGQELLIPLVITDGIIKDSYLANQEEVELLARAVYSESRGEPFKGQVAVAAVILNRVHHELFPDTIKEVIFQPYQFTAVEDGQFWLEPSGMAYTAARAALQGWDPSDDAIFYYNPDTASSDWVFYRNVVVKIGKHYFAV